MYASSGVFSLDDYARSRGASDLDIKVVKALLSVDEQTREMFLKKFTEYLELKEDEREAVPEMKIPAADMQQIVKSAADMTYDEIDAAAEDIRKRMILEKNQAEKSSASSTEKDAS